MRLRIAAHDYLALRSPRHNAIAPANIGMTLDIYSHVLPSLGQKPAGKLDALLA
jgi:NAD(P)H-dependent FMN reductase